MDVIVLVLMGSTYVALRVLAIWGKAPIAFYPDTATYRPPPGGLSYSLLSFVGDAPRMWSVPLVYRMIPGDMARMVFQVTASIVAWLALASAVAGLTVHRALRYSGFAVVLLLSAAPQVATWDQSILSESLTLSAFVGATAAWLRFVSRPSGGVAVTAVALTGYAMFTRPFLFFVGIAAAALCTLWALRSTRRALKLTVAAVLVLLSAWSVIVSARVNDGYRQRDDLGVSYFGEAFGQDLYKRYLRDPEARAYFRARGMPSTEGLPPPSASPPFVDDLQNWVRFYGRLRARPEWLDWLDGGAKAAFLDYIATHPGRNLSDFSRDASGMLSAEPRYGLVEPVPARLYGVLPFYWGSFEPLWFTDLAAWLGLCLLLGGSVVWRRARPAWPVVVIGATVLLTSSLLLFLSWVGSAYELVRHAVPASQLMRIGLIVTAVALADALLSAPSHGQRLEHGKRDRKAH